MSVRAPKWWPALAASLVCCALAVRAALSVHVSGDYVINAPVAGDNAAPAVSALARGDFAAFAAHQPLMGPLSLLLRAPFAAFGTVFGAGNLLTYQLGAIACLLPVALFAGWLVVTCGTVRLPKRSPSVGWIAGALAAAVLVMGHATHDAIQAGHPEEPLTATLATVAVIAAVRRRPVLAGVTLGLAIGTKEWALIAVAPMLLALDSDREKAVWCAVAVALALVGPAAIANPQALLHSGGELAGRRLVNPLSIWWPLGQPLHAIDVASPTARQLPDGLNRLGLAVLLLVGGLFAGAGARLIARDRIKVRDPLALLALLGLVRFVGDPLPQEYYLEALLVPLAAWEVLVAGRLPLMRTTATAFVVMVAGDAAHLSPQALSATTILCSVALGGYLASRVFRDPGVDRLRVSRLKDALISTDVALAGSQLIARNR